MADNPVPDAPNLTFPDTQGAFRFFTQRVLPTVYGDELSYYEVLCKLANIINGQLEASDKDNENLQEVYDYVKQLEELLKQFTEHGFDDYYMDMFQKWMNDNMWCLMSWGSRMVWFGISDDGYFTAYVPDNMGFLDFDVNQDPTSEDYGKLYLSYCQEVYSPCEISCWSDDCPNAEGSNVQLQSNPDKSILEGE